MPLNPYKIDVSLVSIAFQYDITSDVLLELRKTIERVRKNTDDVTKRIDQDSAAFIWETTNSIIENLHGAAFVVCQASITAIISRVKALHTFAKGDGHPISSVPNDKNQMLTFKSSVVASTNVSQVQAIDAVANYFKHNDEWPRGWINPDARSKPTITTLQALGFQFGNSAILTDAVKFFDSNLLSLANAVNVWHEAIVEELKKELTNAGLM
jgi:hypothetical protein